MKLFTTNEAIENIIEMLQDYNGQVSELHNEVFNTDYYIIGYNDADIALREYGVFKALGEVSSFEIENFGEIITDITDPEKVSNMLWYIIGWDVLEGLESYQEYADYYLNDNEPESEKIKKLLIEELETRYTK